MAFKNYDSSGNVLSRSLTDLPVGTIVSTALSAAPSGWLICDGTAVLRTNYPELFGALGTGYGAGNGTTTFNVPNSDGQMILAISTAQRIGVAMPPQFVTTLPSSPIDGQEVYYQSTAAGTGGGASNSMADVGAVWHLRYRAASASTYKWEFVGGGALYSQTATDASAALTSSTWSGINGADPSITVALAGEYMVSNRLTFSFSTALTMISGLKFGSVEASGSDQSSVYQRVSGNYYYSLYSTDMRGIAATTAVNQRYWADASATITRYRASVSITPIRVSA